MHEARLRAGGAAQAMEQLRDQRGVPVLSGLGQDLRLALRSLRATPLVSGRRGAVARAGDRRQYRHLLPAQRTAAAAAAGRRPGRLVHVTDSVRRDTGEIRVRAWSYPFWEQIRQRPQLFAGATAWSFVRFNVAESGETQFVDGLWVDGGFFDALGVDAAAGRMFSAADNRPGGGPDGPVAVIGYGYAERQFSGAAAALGRTLRLNGVTFTIVGVAPRGFFGLEVGRSFDVAVPLGAEPLIRGRDSALGSTSTNFLSIVARLPARSVDRGRDRRSPARAGRDPCRGDRRRTPDERAELERYLASPLTLLPASTGYSNLRRGVPASAADHRRGRRPGPPDRLRERGEPPPGTGAVAPARAERPGRARRAALAAGAAALRGERGVVRIGRRPGHVRRDQSERRFWSASCRRPRPRSSSTCRSAAASSRSRPRRRADDADVRDRTGVPRRRRAADRGHPGAGTHPHRRPRRVDGVAGRGAGRPVDGAPRRGGAVRPLLRDPDRAGSRHRARPRAGRDHRSAARRHRTGAAGRALRAGTGSGSSHARRRRGRRFPSSPRSAAAASRRRSTSRLHRDGCAPTRTATCSAI